MTRKLREQLGLNQKQFAKVLGIGQSAVANYESGIRIPRVSIAKKIVRYAGKHGVDLTLDDLYAQCCKK